MEKLFLGIDLGGSGIRSAAYNRTGQQVFKFFDLNFRTEPDNQALAHYLGRILVEAPNMCPTDNQIVAWGLASPGPLDPEKGIIESPPNLAVRNFKVVDYLEKLFPNLYGCLINDADAALWAEYHLPHGSATKCNRVVGIFAGTGLGSSVISSGMLQRGQGKGAEWGHSSISAFNPKKFKRNLDRICSCGRTNCFESYVGTNGLALTYCEIFDENFDNLSRERIFNISWEMADGLKIKDPRWQAVFTYYTLDLVEGLKNIVMVHNPECIVLGGGIIEGNPRLVNLVRRLLSSIEISMEPMFNGLVIKTPRVENPSVAGAAAYAMHMMDLK